MTTGRMLSRKAIAYLADLLSKTLRVYDLRTILDKLELPRSYASGFYKHEQISSVLENLNDTKDLDKLLEFLNIIFSEYRSRLSQDDIEKIRFFMEPCGIDIINDDEWHCQAILTNPKTGTLIQKAEISALEKLLPPDVINRLEDAYNEYSKGEFENVIPKCRIALEALANFNGFGNGFRDFITKLKKDGILRDIEKDIIGKIHGYLCSFESTHYGPKPNKEQALYALILTQHTLLFLSKIISSKWKNSEWWEHAQIRG